MSSAGRAARVLSSAGSGFSGRDAFATIARNARAFSAPAPSNESKEDFLKRVMAAVSELQQLRKIPVRVNPPEPLDTPAKVQREAWKNAQRVHTSVFFAPAWGETHVVLGAVMGMPYRQLQYTREQGVERQRRLEMRRLDNARRELREKLSVGQERGPRKTSR